MTVFFGDGMIAGARVLREPDGSRKIARSGAGPRQAADHHWAAKRKRRMADMIVVDRDGVEHRVEGKVGVSVMETLRELDWGVAAICGGMCSCATCHIYVDEAWLGRLPAPQPDEKELLQELSGYQPNSRLSCQVQFEESVSGLKLTIAPDE
jgi:2Fe-2S ferredoxin